MGRRRSLQPEMKAPAERDKTALDYGAPVTPTFKPAVRPGLPMNPVGVRSMLFAAGLRRPQVTGPVRFGGSPLPSPR